MAIAESYADTMVAALGTKQQQQHEIEPLTPMGGAIMDQRPTGAIKVQVERDEAKVLQRLKVLSSAAGERFYYRWSVKNKDGTTGWVEGPSIDCALAVARSYGNCDVDVRTQDFPDHWIFYARFTDYETGFTITRAYQQRKNQKTMKTDADRQRDIVFQIGQSKSIRNVICNALSIFTDYAFDEAKAGIVARVGKNLEGYRTKVLARLAELKIAVARVEAVRGRAAKDWLAADVALIIAELQSINDGMATIDETYAPLVAVPVSEKEPERGDFAEKTAAGPIVGTVDVDADTGEIIDEGNAAESASTLARLLSVLPELPDVDALKAWKEEVANERGSLTDADIGVFNTAYIEREKKLAAKKK